MKPQNLAIALIVTAVVLSGLCFFLLLRCKRTRVRVIVAVYYAAVIIGAGLGVVFNDEAGAAFAPLAILTFPWSWLVPYLTAPSYPQWFYRGFLDVVVVTVGIGASLNAMGIMFLALFSTNSEVD